MATYIKINSSGLWRWMDGFRRFGGSRVLVKKPTGPQLVKKFPAFYGSRNLITAFTRARHLSLSSARSIQSMPSHPTSWRSILILSLHLRLGFPNGLFPSGVSDDLNDLIVKVKQYILESLALKIVITIFRNVGNYWTTRRHIPEYSNLQ